MHAFCVGDLGFSDDAAYNRIQVARAARRFAAIVDALRSGAVHLTGLRMLVPHLTPENHRDVLREAAGKSKRAIEELVARLAPQPPGPDAVRKLPESTPRNDQPVGLVPLGVAPEAPETTTLLPALALPAPPSMRPASVAEAHGLGRTTDPRECMQPLAEESYKVQFTASRRLRDKVLEAQDLLRHRVPNGSLAIIVEAAMDLLIDQVKKERFATGRKSRNPSPANASAPDARDPQPADAVAGPAASRHIPDAVKRAVYRRDCGRCTFVDDCGRRCPEKGFLEFDHVDGYARKRRHSVDDLRLLCRAHNQRAAEKMYGRAFMERRVAEAAQRTRPGASSPGPGAVPRTTPTACRGAGTQPLLL
jgi:hypothetical protein